LLGRERVICRGEFPPQASKNGSDLRRSPRRRYGGCISFSVSGDPERAIADGVAALWLRPGNPGKGSVGSAQGIAGPELAPECALQMAGL